jgi:hypothetical protein
MSAVEDTAKPTAQGDDDSLPIDNYGELTVAKILPLLGRLTRAELWRVHEYERRHVNRIAILEAIRRALD